ncbi:hypothetical protein PR048_023005 [Dryococelus australis]|uniref:Uncharacterized protein n=1 Tax=Dryococelus australis TaxID=614101 RepID=A0ABQ9GSW9_9NEOP|nr:hypothetical protein PR048_023005 [Dryococelus australis]
MYANTYVVILVIDVIVAENKLVAGKYRRRIKFNLGTCGLFGMPGIYLGEKRRRTSASSLWLLWAVTLESPNAVHFGYPGSRSPSADFYQLSSIVEACYGAANLSTFSDPEGDRGGAVVTLLTSHLSEPGSIPGEIAFRWLAGFLGISRVPALAFRLCSILTSFRPHWLSRPLYSTQRISLNCHGPLLSTFHVHRTGRLYQPSEAAWEVGATYTSIASLNFVKTSYAPIWLYYRERPEKFTDSFRDKLEFKTLVCLLASHQGDPGSIPGRITPDFRMWESCLTMPLVGGFSRGSPVSPALSRRRCSAFTSIILIGSQYLAVKSRPNRFNHWVYYNLEPLFFAKFLPLRLKRPGLTGWSQHIDVNARCPTSGTSLLRRRVVPIPSNCIPSSRSGTNAVGESHALRISLMCERSGLLYLKETQATKQDVHVFAVQYVRVSCEFMKSAKATAARDHFRIYDRGRRRLSRLVTADIHAIVQQVTSQSNAGPQRSVSRHTRQNHLAGKQKLLADHGTYADRTPQSSRIDVGAGTPPFNHRRMEKGSVNACATSAITAGIRVSVAPVVAFPALYGQISYQGTVQPGGGSILLWGLYVGWNGSPGTRIIVPHQRTVHGLLADPVHPLLHRQQSACDLYLQLDNAPARVLELSTNLDPIKHIWDAVERDLCAVHPAPTYLRALWEVVQQSWTSMAPDALARADRIGGARMVVSCWGYPGSRGSGGAYVRGQSGAWGDTSPAASELPMGVTAKAGSDLLEMCFFRRSHVEKEPAPKDISEIDPNRIICWKTFPVLEGKADNTAVISVFVNASMYSRMKMKMGLGDQIWLYRKLVVTTVGNTSVSALGDRNHFLAPTVLRESRNREIHAAHCDLRRVAYLTPMRCLSLSRRRPLRAARPNLCLPDAAQRRGSSSGWCHLFRRRRAVAQTTSKSCLCFIPSFQRPSRARTHTTTLTQNARGCRGRGGGVVRPLASHLGEPGSIRGEFAPGFSHMCQTVPLVDGFSRRSLVYPAVAFQHRSILTSLHPHRATGKCHVKCARLSAQRTALAVVTNTCRTSCTDALQVIVGVALVDQRERSHILGVEGALSKTSTNLGFAVTTKVKGATVAERLACSPPTKAIRVQAPAGPLWSFASGNRAGRCRWSAGFLGDLLFPRPLIPALLHIHLNNPHRLSRPRYSLYGNTVDFNVVYANIFESIQFVYWLVQRRTGFATPNFRNWESAQDDAVGRRVFSGISRFSPPPNSGSVPLSPRSTLIGSQDIVDKGAAYHACSCRLQKGRAPSTSQTFFAAS